jgi:hypothetical protein
VDSAWRRNLLGDISLLVLPATNLKPLVKGGEIYKNTL